jgi:Predicted AAA-ATPase/PD-(D/E)XK nuclease superfamily
MGLPVGVSDFKKIIDNKQDFVDKSLFIKEIIDDDAEVILITRPRRFGKTLNMSMLNYFFTNYKKRNKGSTKKLFNSLKIAEYKEYMAYQGKHPVIFLSFKDLKENSYEAMYDRFCKVISDLYSEHRYLLDNNMLYEEKKNIYYSILNQKATYANISDSLKDLTEYLFQYYKEKPIILIDEYDIPVHSGYIYQYYEKAVNLFRNFLSAALKDNPNLFKSVLTGILRISRESLFSGLNNLKAYSFLNSKYGEYFGFTEDEVGHLLHKAELKNKANEIKNWYNGYKIGDHILYNPWSIASCIHEKGKLVPYWVNTSDDELIKKLLLQSNLAFKDRFELLLQDKTIKRIINENFVFSDLDKNHESAIWSLLLMTGYLKIFSYQETDQGSECQLSIPNREIRNLYRKIIEKWLSGDYGMEWYSQFITNLLDGNMINFEKDLQHIFEQTISYHDFAKNPEAFYHGFVIGLTASLYGHPNYEIQSNRESGYGRFDYLIFSRDPEKPTIIFEFKKVDPEVNDEKRKEIAQQALKQIDKQRYVEGIRQYSVKNILKIGIAFSNKRFSLEYEKNF